MSLTKVGVTAINVTSQHSPHTKGHQLECDKCRWPNNGSKIWV